MASKEEQKKIDQNANEEQIPEAQTGEMKRGDYVIHIFIENTKEIKTPPNSTLDPMFEIQCLGLKKYSSSKSKIGGLTEITWNEHVFIEPRNVEKQDAEDAKIIIMLKDKGFVRNSLIGSFEFKLSYIYFLEHQALLHQWIAICNPDSDKYDEITGYVKLSIAIAATGDKKFQIKDDDETGPVKPIMMPPQLNPKFYQLKFQFFQASGIPPMDRALSILQQAKTDGYVYTVYKNQKLKSKVQTIYYKDGKNQDAPINWNQEFLIPAQVPIINPRIIIKLMDEDAVNDEIIGSLMFNLNDIINQSITDRFKWKNIYGSNLNLPDSSEKQIQNENPNLAPNWKGRVLMRITAEECEKPLAKVQEIDEEYIALAQQSCTLNSFDIIAEVGQGVCLPESGKKYSIKLIICDKVWQTREAVYSSKNYNRWNQRFDLETIQMQCQNLQDVGRLTVILMDGESPVCFFSDVVTNYEEANAQWRWISLKPDPAVGRVKEANNAGMISIKFSISQTRKRGVGDLPLNKSPSWLKKPPLRCPTIKIRAYIYQCRELPAADADGTSDPFVQVWDVKAPCEGQTAKQNLRRLRTKVVADNLNPLFFEVIEFEYEVRNINDLESYPPFILDIYDKDVGTFGDNEDFLGRAVIEPEDCGDSLIILNEDDPKDKIPTKPKWHPIKFRSDGPSQGAILVSFSVSDLDFAYKFDPRRVDLRSRVEFKEMNVQMLVLGLRNLKSAGILPVKNAFIQFNFQGLVSSDFQAISNIRTQPKSSGPNPTINTTISVKVPLPADPLFSPNLMAQVYDQVFIKLTNQPLIGVFSIPLGLIYLNLIETRTQEILKIRNISNKLDQIIQDGANQPKNFEVNGSLNVFDRSNENISLNTGDIESKRNYNQLANKILIQKNFKNSELKDGLDYLGANEKQGINRAIVKRDYTMQELQKIKSDVNKGILKSNSFMNDQGIRKTDQKSQIFFVKKPGDTLQDKAFLLAQYEEAFEKEKRMTSDGRLKDLEALSPDEQASTIIRPQYELDKRLQVYKEQGGPPDSLFLALGWDEDHMTGRKHYRQYFDEELEKVKDIFVKESPFNSYEIKRGQTRGIQKSIFDLFGKAKKQDASGEISTEQVVGYFKSIVEVESGHDKVLYNLEKTTLIRGLLDKLNHLCKNNGKNNIDLDLKQLESVMVRRKLENQLRQIDASHLGIIDCLLGSQSDDILRRALLAQTKCVVRLYMISAFDLSSRDNDSPSDPYLYIQCNNKVYNERDNYQLDEESPSFLKYFDFEAQFPGCSPITIDIFDYDAIFGDDIIGTTHIDLEDRYFNMKWQALDDKPAEYRQIYHPSSTIGQGTVICWVEIIPYGLIEETEIFDISEKPPEIFEVRICVLNCENVAIMDAEGTSDVFFRGFFDTKEEVQETDTHFRNTDGCPDFQYRLVFRIKVDRKRKDFKFKLQCYDKDIFQNEIIGENSVNLKPLFEDCSLIKKPISFTKQYQEDLQKIQKKKEALSDYAFDATDKSKFWLHMNYKEPGSIHETSRGRVKIQIDVLPAELADKNPVGKAQSEPNHSPFLPKPQGRFEFSLNPLKILNQLVGRGQLNKALCYLCLCFTAVLFIFMLPTILSNLISSLIISFWPKQK